MNGTRAATASSCPSEAISASIVGPSGPSGLPPHTRLVDQSYSSAGANNGNTTDDTTVTTTLNSGNSNKIMNGDHPEAIGVTPGGAGMSDLVMAASAKAKADKNATPKPKMSFEVKPFTTESLEKINLRTSNLIRDYGYLPKRKPNLMDGAELPAKYEPFPPELLGKPVEEIDQYVYEKVRISSIRTS